MATRQDLMKKWQPILEAEGLDPIKDNHRKEVTAILLENQEVEMRKQAGILNESPTNSGGGGLAQGHAGDTEDNVAGLDPVLISLVRRAMPQMIAYDIAGVQPMTQPTGLIFAMKSRYTNQAGAEALFNEADTDFAGTGTAAGSNRVDGTYTTGTGMTTAAAEALGDGSGPEL